MKHWNHSIEVRKKKRITTAIKHCTGGLSQGKKTSKE